MRIAVSNSFTKGEAEILTFVFETLLRGGDARMATRHKDFAGLAAKVGRMRQRVDEMKKRQGGDGGEETSGTTGE